MVMASFHLFDTLLLITIDSKIFPNSATSASLLILFWTVSDLGTPRQKCLEPFQYW